jgi:hypothetical protein
MLLDLETRYGDAGRVGEAQVALVGQRLGGDDGDLAGAAETVVIEGVFALCHEARNLTVSHAF